MKFLTNKKAFIIYVVWILSLLPNYFFKYNAYRKREPGEEIPRGYPTDIPVGMQNYVVVEGILYFIIGVFITFLIQYGIEKFVKSSFSLGKKILYIGVFIIAALLIYIILMFPLCGVLQEYFTGTNESSGAIAGTTVLNVFILSTWYLVYELFHMFEKNKKAKLKQAQLESSLRESQLNTLKGQINPHFMFNSLNNIRGLMLEDVERSREMLTSLSEILRYSLLQTKNDSIALSEEMEMIDNFIDLSKIQFEERLQFSVDIDPNLMEIKIPPMIIQLLVENAIKHGIAKLPEGGKVHVSVQEEKGFYKINVSNTGSLAYSEDSTKLGLENIHKRLELLYGEQASFSLIEQNNEVIAACKLPIA